MFENALKQALRKLNSLAYRVQRWKNEQSDRLLANRLSSTSDYSFTEDYVQNNLVHWEQHLAPFKGQPGMALVEIGSYEGRSAVWFLENILTDPGATLTCVDPFAFRGIEPRFDHNIRMTGDEPKVTKIKDASANVLAKLDEESIDIIYVDGDHRAAPVLMDAHLAWRALRPDGVLIFDDYLWERDRPSQDRPQIAIDLFLAAYRDGLELLHKDYQVIVRKRVA